MQQHQQDGGFAKVTPCLALLVQPVVHAVSILLSVTFIQRWEAIACLLCMQSEMNAWHISHHKRPTVVDIA